MVTWLYSALMRAGVARAENRSTTEPSARRKVTLPCPRATPWSKRNSRRVSTLTPWRSSAGVLSASAGPDVVARRSARLKLTPRKRCSASGRSLAAELVPANTVSPLSISSCTGVPAATGPATSTMASRLPPLAARMASMLLAISRGASAAMPLQAYSAKLRAAWRLAAPAGPARIRYCPSAPRAMERMPRPPRLSSMGVPKPAWLALPVTSSSGLSTGTMSARLRTSPSICGARKPSHSVLPSGAVAAPSMAKPSTRSGARPAAVERAKPK